MHRRRGDGDVEDRALAQDAAAENLAAMRVDNALGHREAEAGTAHAARRRVRGLGERLEDAVTFGARDADAGVLHFDDQRRVRVVGARREVGPQVPRREIQRLEPGVAQARGHALAGAQVEAHFGRLVATELDGRGINVKPEVRRRIDGVLSIPDRK